ncbi:phosphotransferase enzyme family protein [Risungbinella massiliensis]|uniref:phosphotransferase enzyme family protein n=1 Tax=Risungbinella massiliensis TaxID=1329796 RepID=UPI0005CC8C85|nr:phosphotransferase [Risungbinella massiliensis]
MWKTEILEEAVLRFQGDPASISLLGGLHQNVYEYERNGEASILKLIPFATKDRNLVYSELQWIAFLRKNGLQVPTPMLSKRGSTIEVINRLPVPCCVISFPKSEGKLLHEHIETYWNPNFFKKWGQTMGKLHSLTPKFQKANTDLIFEEWNEGEVFYRDFSFIDPAIVEVWVKCINKVPHFEKTEESYGIIHNSFHHENFFITSAGDLLLFNLNHCKHHYFTYDIGTALFHSLKLVEQHEQPDFVKMFLSSFAEGYQQEKSLVRDWEEQVFFFTMYRQLMVNLKQAIFLQGGVLTKEQREELLAQKRNLLPGDYVLYWQKILQLR